MFILAILQQFEIYHKNPSNPVLFIKNYIDDIRRTWIEYCLIKKKKKLKLADFLAFLKMLGQPLGLEPETEFFEGAKKYVRMSIIAYIFEFN